jgi:hypothetical protein
MSPSTALADGGYGFTVTATDPLGHSRTSAPFNFTVDGTPPDTVISAGPRGFTRDATPAFAFSSADPGARFECRFDARSFTPCSGSTGPGGRLSQGSHRFEVRASDLAGNVDASAAARRFTVDTVRPRARIRRHPSRVTHSSRATFKFAASERVRRFECRVDHKRFARCRTPRRVRVKPGRHRFQVRAVDRAGNRSRAASFRWRVLPS